MVLRNRVIVVCDLTDEVLSNLVFQMIIRNDTDWKFSFDEPEIGLIRIDN